MKRQLLTVTMAASLGIVQFQALAQNAAQTPPPSADPYANNPDAGKLQFPLAAPAGKDSGAIRTALPPALRALRIDPSSTLRCE